MHEPFDIDILAQTLLCPPFALESLPAQTPRLLRWYDANARVLPWRGQADPYRIWVSEIMLQQTRVEAVIEAYTRFLQVLPSIAALADVNDDQLLKLWEGLGYYRRARNLKKAAQIVMGQHGGQLPASYEALLQLPGIGEYTAGAIASIAFGIAVPAPDGNVQRVLTRFLGSYADIAKTPVQKALRTAATSLLDTGRPGDLNQALMELGATVCLPNGTPHCADCPLYESCSAGLQGNYAELPVKSGKKPRRAEQHTVILLRSPEGVLLVRRPASGLLAGLLEPLRIGQALNSAEVESAVTAMGAQVESIVPLQPYTHIFSHVEWQMRGFAAVCASFTPAIGFWADEQAIRTKHALPSAFSPFFQQLHLAFSPQVLYNEAKG